MTSQLKPCNPEFTRVEYDPEIPGTALILDDKREVYVSNVDFTHSSAAHWRQRVPSLISKGYQVQLVDCRYDANITALTPKLNKLFAWDPLTRSYQNVIMIV